MKTYDEILTLMQDTYRDLAGFSPDDASDIGIRLKVLAASLADLEERAAWVERQAFPQTAAGDCLELHAATRGLSRKPAARAQGLLRFRREQPASADIAVEAGVLCTTRAEEPVHFETTERGVLPAGEREVDIPARAVEAGAMGNAAAGAACLLVSTPPGISGVENPREFSGGADAESDGELRRRLLRSYGNISNSTNAAYYYDLAMGQEGVASVNVLPRRRGRGTVDVVVAGRSQQGEGEAVAALEALFAEKKEINVDVSVTAAQAVLQPVALELAVEEGSHYGTVAARVEEAARALLDAMEVGEPLLLAALSSRLYGVDGVYNLRTLAPAADVAPGEDRVLRCGGVAVNRMGGS